MKLSIVCCGLVGLWMSSNAWAGKECGKNLGCLVLAAKTCTTAKAMHEVSFNLMGIQMKTRVRYEITGREGKNCLFEKTTISGSASLDPKLKADILAKGKDPAQLEKEMNRQLKEQIGKTVRCKATPSALAKQIERWKSDRFATGDLCQPTG